MRRTPEAAITFAFVQGAIFHRSIRFVAQFSGERMSSKTIAASAASMALVVTFFLSPPAALAEDDPGHVIKDGFHGLSIKCEGRIGGTTALRMMSPLADGKRMWLGSAIAPGLGRIDMCEGVVNNIDATDPWAVLPRGLSGWPDIAHVPKLYRVRFTFRFPDQQRDVEGNVTYCFLQHAHGNWQLLRCGYSD